MPAFDPLEGLEARPLEAQVGILANEVRNQRNALSEVKEELRYVKRALWGVVFTVLAGMVLFLATTKFNGGVHTALMFMRGLV